MMSLLYKYYFLKVRRNLSTSTFKPSRDAQMIQLRSSYEMGLELEANAYLQAGLVVCNIRSCDFAGTFCKSALNRIHKASSHLFE